MATPSFELPSASSVVVSIVCVANRAVA